MTQVTTHVVHFDEKGYHEDIFDQPFIPEDKLVTQQKFLWVHLEGERDIVHLMPLFDELGFDISHLDTLHDLNQRPKMEMYKNYAHCVSKFELLSQKTKSNYTKNLEKITLFFNDNVVLTYHPSTRPIFTGIRDSLQEDKDFRKRGPMYLAYTLLDTILDAYQPTLENYEHYIDHIEDVVIAHPSRENFISIHNLKKQLISAHTSLWHFTQSIEDLTDEPPAYMDNENLTHFEKLNTQAHHSLERIDGFREATSGLVDLFFSSQGSKLNDIMKILTIVSVIFLPLDYLTGLWGIQYGEQSVWNMFELNRGSGYALVTGSAVILCVLMYWYFRRKGWLSDDETHVPRL